MPSPGYDPSRIEGTLLRLPSFGSFFGLFAPFLPSYITVLNTPSTRSTVSSSSTLIPTTLNRRICRVIARLNR